MALARIHIPTGFLLYDWSESAPRPPVLQERPTQFPSMSNPLSGKSRRNNREQWAQPFSATISVQTSRLRIQSALNFSSALLLAHRLIKLTTKSHRLGDRFS